MTSTMQRDLDSRLTTIEDRLIYVSKMGEKRNHQSGNSPRSPKKSGVSFAPSGVSFAPPDVDTGDTGEFPDLPVLKA